MGPNNNSRNAIEREIEDLAGSSEHDIAGAAAAALPNARRETLEVQGHVADPAMLGPILSAFFTG